jgi:hypothetical protein
MEIKGIMDEEKSEELKKYISKEKLDKINMSGISGLRL